MVEIIVSTDTFTKVSNESDYLVKIFGEEYKNKNSIHKEFNNFLKGHKDLIIVKEEKLKEINIDPQNYIFLYKNKYYYLFKNIKMKKLYMEKNDDNAHKVNGELFRFPPKATDFFIKRKPIFDTPGIYNDKTVTVHWADSTFVTNEENLADDLKWMKNNNGTIDGHCFIYKSMSNFNIIKNEGEHYLHFLEKDEIYTSPNFENIYNGIIAVKIEDITI
jgi:hypothetical protein